MRQDEEEIKMTTRAMGALLMNAAGNALALGGLLYFLSVDFKLFLIAGCIYVGRIVAAEGKRRIRILQPYMEDLYERFKVEK